MKRNGASIAVVLVVGVTAGVAWAAPEAGTFSSSWLLDFQFHDPQRLSVRLPGDQEETTFWYVLYNVTNNTKMDIQFYPSFRLVTDTLQGVEGGADVSPIVYDLIAAQHKKEFPFLAPPAKITGLLLQGEENARASVAVFREFAREANSITIYVSGLSGEIVRVRNPAFDPKKSETEVNARAFLMRRTLAISYGLPGDDKSVTRAIPVRRTRTWVMQ
ncbi:MAG: hypothetical protein AABZ47_08680 [Planctomycetota bacterium]